ncbi:MAG: creatininase family protein [Burkholderiales bacterium]|nr:creatininase family protein [Burkholderiales bacterium]
MLRVLVLAAGLLAGVAATAADAPQTVFLEEHTSTELASAIEAGRTTIIVPIGGTEQNGPHIVLGKHNVRAKALAAKVAAALGNALVAPVVAYVPEGGTDPPTGHMRYPGTITVPPDAYRKVLISAARSFRLHGFRDIVLLGDHGDYQKDNQAVAAALAREWAGTGVRVHAIAEYYRAATEGFAQSLKTRGHTDAEIGLHAGLADTSLALAVDPKLVRVDRLAAAGPLPARGVTGDPRRASAVLGQAGVDAIVAQSVDAIRAVTARR